MSHKMKWAIAILGTAIAVWFVSDVTRGPALVEVPDPALKYGLQLAVAHAWYWEYMTQDEIAKTAPAIALTRDNLGFLKDLTIEKQEIQSTVGLEHCVNLTKLTLDNCGIVDISFVRFMPKLTTLNLPRNAIWDVTPLGIFKSFAWLRLSGNRIADIKAFRGMNFGELDLNNNMVADAAPLKGSQIMDLYLAWNSLTDFPEMDYDYPDKLVVSDNPLNEDACERLRRAEANQQIENLITDCPKESESTNEPTAEEYSGVVYTADGTYHRLKDCAGLKGKTVGVTKTSKAIEKGLTPCPTCAAP